jgi:DNA adenine methylase
MTAPARPVLRYHGGKWRIAPWIIGQFPVHDVYVEPYGGGASVLMRKPRSTHEVYNDLDADVVNVFRVLRDRSGSAELERLLSLTPWSRREFRDSYLACDDPIERARRTIVRCFMAHGTTSRRASRTGFRGRCWPDGGGGAGDWPGYRTLISSFTDRLERVVIEEAPAADVIKRYDSDNALFYVDPPYPIGTRTSIRWGTEGDRAYAHEMSDDEHRELAALLHRTRGAVVISGYACPLYDDELYAGWTRLEKKASADRGAQRIEITWTKPAGARPIPGSALVQSSMLEALNG